MKKSIIILGIISLIAGGCKQAEQAENALEDIKPYEATWLRISETDDGYVIYNYLSLWDDKTIAPMSITIRNDFLIWVTYHDDVGRYSLKKVNIEERKNGSYFFPVGNQFLFIWYDKKNHIAQWKIYGDVEKDEPLTDYLYIDSRYNTFPIVDYEWD